MKTQLKLQKTNKGFKAAIAAVGNFIKKPTTIKALSIMGVCVLALTAVAHAQTVDGINTGFDTAGSTVKGLFSRVSTLVYAVAGVTGLVGGVRVYQKFQSEDQTAQKALISYVSAIVFLLIAGTVLKTVFGL